ncbi:MAG: hypothetical protein AABW85_02480 [archaeon]
MRNEELVKSAIAGFLLFASFFLWAFFLNASGVSVQTLASFSDFGALFKSLTSIWFILFLVFFPVSYALLVAFTRLVEKRTLQGIAATAFILDGVIFLFVFPGIAQEFLLGFFYLISLVVAVEVAFVKFRETKSLALFRVPHSSVSQAMGILGIGLFVSTALFVLPIQPQMVSDFEKKLFENFKLEDVQSDVADTTSKIIVQTQTETLKQLIATPSFSAMSRKEDSDVVLFVTMMDTLYVKVQEPQYASDLKQKIAAQNANTLTQGKFEQALEQVKKKLPIFSIFENYFWLIAALASMSIFFFASTIIIKPIGTIFGALFSLIAEQFNKKVPEDEPPQQY